MKKTHKKVLGLVGLGLVAAVTAFAASLPTPEALAKTDPAPVEDKIEVRVVGTDPIVEFTGMPSGTIITSPTLTETTEYKIGGDYYNVETISATLQYTDTYGNSYEAVPLFEGEDLDVNYVSGSFKFTNIDLKTGEYSYSYLTWDDETKTEVEKTGGGTLANIGYGSYTLTLNGTGYEGKTAEPNTTSFSYLPAYGYAGTTTAPDGTVDNYVNVYYTPTGQAGGEVSSIKVVVKDSSGEIRFTIGPLAASSDGFSHIDLPFESYGLEDGKYTIEVYAYGADSTDPLAAPYIIPIEYKENKIIVPDTGAVGGLFGSLNISRADYLATGLIAFGVIAVAGTMFITQNKRQKKATATRSRNARKQKAAKSRKMHSKQRTRVANKKSRRR